MCIWLQSLGTSTEELSPSSKPTLDLTNPMMTSVFKYGASLYCRICEFSGKVNCFKLVSRSASPFTGILASLNLLSPQLQLPSMTLKEEDEFAIGTNYLILCSLPLAPPPQYRAYEV